MQELRYASLITTRACAWARVRARACVCVRVPVRLTLGTMFNILTYEIRTDTFSSSHRCVVNSEICELETVPSVQTWRR